ncbi:nuclease SbcCD subunit D [Catellatospora sp. TT07R-123]|uniref:exonuclease SbcCD subunit D n=1 Tax=Catellatospora sp. TT07R-123 TaxID=2733863 RepID=UPI001B0DB39D|nr:exonuclease SbcCD subunit D [Catellatospora sp. TT07R-123]GHJ49566.1 nuclease SbcCD subunit D [Catellatospora sp. TT07R-123]
MKILHTSDWHVGKVLKGRSRVSEQITALYAVVQVAQAERPDLIIVAGDLFDVAAPSPEATKVVTRALSALRATGAEVLAIAGNHDNGAALDALRSWADAAGIILRGRISEHPADHVVSGTTPGGEKWRCVALPFLSQRYAIRALEMFSLTEAEAQATYADHLARLLGRLATEAFTEPDTVNLVTAHLTVTGGTMGGGERDAHCILGYSVPATVFPANAHYVALGHLHRAQLLPGPCPVRYSGSPIAVDFGEEENRPSVTIVEVTAQTAAKARVVPLADAVPLRTLRGTLADLAVMAEQLDDEPWLRVYVAEPPRAGLREQVQELFPRALEIRVDPSMLPDAAARNARPRHTGRSAPELFGDYLKHRGHADEATRSLFERLYTEVSG